MAEITESAARPAPPAAPPSRRHPVWRIVKALLPLLIIAVLIYVGYNFPALQSWLTYKLVPPKVGNTALLPATTYGQQGAIPVGGSEQCGQPIGYDGQGNPKLICDNYLYIPKIRVAAPIVWPQSTDDAVINDALLKGVLHYPGTADPGQQGNVFLTGHSSYYWWVNTAYRNVFTLVPQLSTGDEIVIYGKGIRYTYRVSDTFEINPNQTEVLQPTSRPVVTLSTCVPIGTNYRRHIVRADQVSPDPNTARDIPTGNVSGSRVPGVR